MAVYVKSCIRERIQTNRTPFHMIKFAQVSAFPSAAARVSQVT